MSPEQSIPQFAGASFLRKELGNHIIHVSNKQDPDFDHRAISWRRKKINQK